MSKRDVIKDIESKRKRQKQKGVFLPRRLLAIYDSFHKLGTDERELSKYYPIGLIACLEGYIRSQICALIDSGSPYCDNLLHLNGDPNIKIDLSTAVSIYYQRKITLGEFISHLLPLTGVEGINKYMSAVLGFDFLRSLVSAVPYRMDKATGQPIPIGDIIKNVEETFRLRHIFAHEVAENQELDPELIKLIIDSVMQFLTATHNLVWPLLDPEAHLSNVEAQNRRAKQLPVLRSEMQRLLRAIRERLGVNQAKHLDRSQRAWNSYFKEFRLAMVEPFLQGTISGFIHIDAEIAALEYRIHDLKRFCYWVGIADGGLESAL